MDNNDYLILKYLSQFDKPVAISEEKVPDEIRNNLEFFGLDVNKHPNSIWVRLFMLEKQNLIKHPYPQSWEITPHGREQYSDFHYELTGNPIGAIIIKTTIKEACEIIFSKHLEAGNIIWTKEAFKLKYPENLNEARDRMLQEGIIHKANSRILTTFIDSDYEDAKSYEEASIMRKEKNKPLPSTHIKEQYNISGTKGTAVGKVTGLQNEVKTIPATTKKEKNWKEVLKEEVTKHGVKYLFTALTFFTIGLISGKGCNLRDHQERNIQSNSTKKDSVQSNQDSSYHY